MTTPIALKEFVIQMAEYYERELTETVILLYAADLSRASLSDIAWAFEIYRRDPKNTRMPLPAQLLAILRPQVSERDDAIETSRRLEAAASRQHSYWDTPRFVIGRNGPCYDSSKGYMATFQEACEADVGEIGYQVIRRFGGWKRFYDAFVETDAGQFHAQIRDMVESTIRRVRAGAIDHLPTLDSYRPRIASPDQPLPIPFEPEDDDGQ